MPLSPDDTGRRLQLLYEVTSLHAGSHAARLDAALEVVTQALGLEVGILSRIEDEQYIVERLYAPNCPLRPGDTAPLSSTYSSLTLQTSGVLSIDRIGTSVHAQHPLYLDYGFEAYLSAVVRVDGALYGTLSFVGGVRPVPFARADEELVVLLARWVGISLGAQRAEAQRRESEARFQSAFHDAAIGMALVAPDGRFLELNASFCQMLGYSRRELLALTFQELTYPEDREADLARFRQVLEGQQDTYQLEKRYLHKEGHVVWGHLSVSAVRHNEGHVKYLVGQVQDVDARKRYEVQIERMAYHDDLTGLHNRRYFFEHAPPQLALAHREAWPVTLVYIDLNGFKQVNDQLGHQAGDALLRQVAVCFRGTLRASDLLARVGGDEFVALLLNTTEEEARLTASRLALCVQQPQQTSTGLSPLGMSVGIVVASNVGTIDVLLKHADEAMYRSKTRKAEEPYAVEVVTLKPPSD